MLALGVGGAAVWLWNMGGVSVEVVMVMLVQSGMAVALGGRGAAMDDRGGWRGHIVRECPLSELFCDVSARRHVRQSSECILARVVVDLRAIHVVAGAGSVRLSTLLPHWLGGTFALEDES